MQLNPKYTRKSATIGGDADLNQYRDQWLDTRIRGDEHYR